MTNANKCRCKPTFIGRCCEIPVSASVDRCDREIRAPDGGDLKCGRAKPEPVNPLDQDQAKLRNGRERLPYNWSCTSKCPAGQGMYKYPSVNDQSVQFYSLLKEFIWQLCYQINRRVSGKWIRHHPPTNHARNTC